MPASPPKTIVLFEVGFADSAAENNFMQIRNVKIIKYIELNVGVLREKPDFFLKKLKFKVINFFVLVFNSRTDYHKKVFRSLQ